MKRYIIFTVLALMTFVGCQKSLVDQTPALPSEQTLTVSVQANGNDQKSRVALTDGESNVALDWESDDSFTLYSIDGERVVDFKYAAKTNDGRILFTSADESVKLSDNESYIAIYPSVEGVATLYAHRAELESRLSEQTQTGNDNNSHIEKALRMEAEFTYSASTDTKVIFEHKMATMRLTFSTKGDVVPTKIVFLDGEFMSYTVNLNEVNESDIYTTHFVIKPNEAGEDRAVALNVYDGSALQQFSKTSSVTYHAGVQYRSTLYSNSFKSIVSIYNKEDLINFRDQVNSGNNRLCAVLMNDIDLEDEEWTPIGKYPDYPFSGTFDGDDYEISGLYIRKSCGQGLFSYAYKAKIENLKVSGSVKESLSSGGISGYQYTGGIVGFSFYSSLTNCHNASDVSGSVAGGLVGCSYNTSITNCQNSGEVNGTLYAGGVIARSASDNITDSNNAGVVNGVKYVIGTGGIVGITNATYLQNNQFVKSELEATIITQCYNSGDINGSSGVGGILGYTDEENQTISKCYNTGDVSARSYDVGGIAGLARSISNCYNSGMVSGEDDNTGGVSGISYFVENCYNTGDVSGCGEYVGGIVGFLPQYSSINKCYNTGNIQGNGRSDSFFAGGIVSRADNSSVTNCYNTGYVSGSNNNSYGCYCYVGGILGQADESIVVNCYNDGDVNSNTKDSPDNPYGAASSAGGIAGSCVSGSWTKTSVINCYNLAEASCTSTESCHMGDIMGISGHAHITNCYYPADSKMEAIGYTWANDQTVIINLVSMEDSQMQAESFVNTLNRGVAEYNDSKDSDRAEACNWIRGNANYPTLDLKIEVGGN